MIVLGIDPGSRVTGYGVIEITPEGERTVEYGIIRLEGRDDHALRLRQVHERLLAVIERCAPDECAVEMPVYASNAQSMLKLGRAQAAAMLAALLRDIPVTEYTPAQVKKSVTGTGRASKEQVRYMVHTILQLPGDDPKMAHDASDALAVSLCHAHRNTGTAPTSRGGWKQFIRDNPDRVI